MRRLCGGYAAAMWRGGGYTYGVHVAAFYLLCYRLSMLHARAAASRLSITGIYASIV
jgi:hypothetical protein